MDSNPNNQLKVVCRSFVIPSVCRTTVDSSLSSRRHCQAVGLAAAGIGDAFPFFDVRRKSSESKYNTAARIMRERIPVHNEADSSMPPTSAPKRFEPSASPLKLYSAKLRMKTIEANATGEHNTSVANSAFTQKA